MQSRQGQSLIQFEHSVKDECGGLSQRVYSTWLEEQKKEKEMLKSLSADSEDSGKYFLADSEEVKVLEDMHAHYDPALSVARCREGRELFETIVKEAQRKGAKTKAK